MPNWKNLPDRFRPTCSRCLLQVRLLAVAIKNGIYRAQIFLQIKCFRCKLLVFFSRLRKFTSKLFSFHKWSKDNTRWILWGFFFLFSLCKSLEHALPLFKWDDEWIFFLFFHVKWFHAEASISLTQIKFSFENVPSKKLKQQFGVKFTNVASKAVFNEHFN